MNINRLYLPIKERPMTVTGFMSGSGTNLLKILEYEQKVFEQTGNKPYEVNLIFTDNKNSNAKNISERYRIPLVVNDILDFYADNGKSDKKDLTLRPKFDEKSIALLADYEFDMIALAGYMSIVTQPIFAAYAGRIVNVHPADLSVMDGDNRRYTGDRAVAAAIKHGEKNLYATTHLVGERVDYGEILMISYPVPVNLPDGLTIEDLGNPKNRSLLNKIAVGHQELLKEKGDWDIFPKTLEMIAQGRFAINDAGVVCLDEKPIPGGFRLE